MNKAVVSQGLLTQERNAQKLRENLLRPIADRFGFPLGHKTTAVGLPTVLCLGNHSSGKSTFINHLAGAKIQETGVAPTDDGFTIIMYGESEATQDGHATVVDPTLSYGDLEQYGKSFLDHLKLKRRPLPALQQICLIDSPGLIDNPGEHGDRSRGYDFKAVVRAFAEAADLIVFFFDPDKPGTTGESLRVFTDSLPDVMYKLLIVFNKVDEFGDVRDFARTYGSLCWNLSRVVRTKDIPPIYCTFVPDHSPSTLSSLDLTDFEKSTDDLKQEIARVDERRRINVVSALLDSARQIRLHAMVVRHIGKQLMGLRLSLWLVVALMAAAGGYLIAYHRETSYGISGGAMLLGLAAVLLFGIGFILRAALKRSISRLDAIFHDVFREELLRSQNSRFLEELWSAVKPRTEQFLSSVSPRRVPFSPTWIPRFRKLQHAIDSEIPQMLSSTTAKS